MVIYDIHMGCTNVLLISFPLSSICAVTWRRCVDKYTCIYNGWLKNGIVITRYVCVCCVVLSSVFYVKAIIELSQERDFYKSQQVC